MLLSLYVQTWTVPGIEKLQSVGNQRGEAGKIEKRGGCNPKKTEKNRKKPKKNQSQI